MVASNLTHTTAMLTIGFVAPNACRGPGARLLRFRNRSRPMFLLSVHSIIKSEGKWKLAMTKFGAILSVGIGFVGIVWVDRACGGMVTGEN